MIPMKPKKTKGLPEVLYRIFLGNEKVFENTDREVVTRELTRLNAEAWKEASENNLNMDQCKKYDLRVWRDPNVVIPPSPLLHDSWMNEPSQKPAIPYRIPPIAPPRGQSRGRRA